MAFNNEEPFTGVIDKMRWGLWCVAIILITSGLFLIFKDFAPQPTVPASQVLGIKTKTSGCTENNGLPDPDCTPGDIDPQVSQDNIQTTICVSGYTTRVRPGTSYTNNLKIKQIQEYGYIDTNPKSYQEDHLIPLELGGNPISEDNLWPQPINLSLPAKDKDDVENYLHEQVCSDKMTLRDAQFQIATNWAKVHKDMTGIGALILKIL